MGVGKFGVGETANSCSPADQRHQGVEVLKPAVEHLTRVLHLTKTDDPRRTIYSCIPGIIIVFSVTRSERNYSTFYSKSDGRE